MISKKYESLLPPDLLQLRQNDRPSFWQVFISPSMLSRACRPLRLTVPPEIFRLMTNPRRSRSEAFVFSGVSGRSKTRSSSALRRFSRTSS